MMPAAVRWNCATQVIAAGQLNSQGVDESTSVVLQYSNGRTASLISHSRIDMEKEVGTNETADKTIHQVSFKAYCYYKY